MARLAPDNERAFDAILEQMQAELGFGALATRGRPNSWKRKHGSAQRRAEVKKRTETEATPTWSGVAPTWRNFTVLNVNTPRYQVQSSTA